MDTDGSVTTYRWLINGVEVSRDSAFRMRLPVGSNNISFLVMDDDGLWSTQVTMTIEVSDKLREIIPPAVGSAGLAGSFIAYRYWKKNKTNVKKDERLPKKSLIAWSLFGPETSNEKTVKVAVEIRNIGTEMVNPLTINLSSTMGTGLTESTLKTPEISPGSTYKGETSMILDPSSGNGVFNVMATIDGALVIPRSKKLSVEVKKIGYSGAADSHSMIHDYLKQSNRHWGYIKNPEKYIEFMTHDLLIFDKAPMTDKMRSNLDIYKHMGKVHLVDLSLSEIKSKLESAY
jgi:hypothetical protein